MKAVRKKYTKPHFDITGKQLFGTIRDFICPYCGNHGYTFLFTEGKVKMFGRILDLSDYRLDTILEIADFKTG